MKYESELEQLVSLLALMADVMRRLAAPQEEDSQNAIKILADDVEGIADRLIELIFPRRVKANETEQPGPT